MDSFVYERHRSGAFIVNFEQISPIVLMFPMLNLNKEMPAGKLLFKQPYYGKSVRRLTIWATLVFGVNLFCK